MNAANPDKKKKGGRPKKSSLARKSKTVAVCLSEPELYALRHRAETAKLSLSEYCRDAILDGVIKEPVKNFLKSDYPPPKEVAFRPIYGCANENSLNIKGKA